MLPDEVKSVLAGDIRWCVLGQDCMPFLEGLPLRPVFDHVMTDPPYDTETHENARAHVSGTRKLGVVDIPIDFEPVDPVVLGPLLVRAAARWALAFCSLEMLGGYRTAVGKAWVRSGIWHRTNGAPQFSSDRPAQSCEGIATMHRPKVRKRWNGKGKQAFWAHGVDHERGRHPTKKPLPLMLDLITDFTGEGDVILDPFCGDGTTGEACLLTGRRFVGIELQEKYAVRAVARCRRAEQTWLDKRSMREAFDAAMDVPEESVDLFQLAMEEG